jgi:hypothetical protein
MTAPDTLEALREAREALRRMVEEADNAAWAVNTCIMDGEIANARQAISRIDAALASDHIGNSTTMVPALGVEGVARSPILRGVGKIDGDGWKDTTFTGEVVFVWNDEMPPPYAPGQYPRVGKEGWSASTRQYDFTPATADDARAIIAAMGKNDGAAQE